MNGQYSALGIILLLFAMGTLSLTFRSYQRPFTRFNTYFICLTLSVFLWYMGSGLALLSSDASTKIMWTQITYIGATTVAAFWFLLVMSFTKYDKYFKPLSVGLLLLTPLIITIMALTNAWHGLIWPSITPVSSEPGALLLYEQGPLFYINIFYSYSLLLVGTIILSQKIRTEDKKNKQKFYILILSGLIPLIFSLIYASGLSPIPGLDITPFGLSFSVILLFLGIFRYNLLDINQIAHDLLLRNIKSGVMIFDNNHKLLEVNPAASMLDINDDDLGNDINDVLKDLGALKSYYHNPSGDNEIFLKDYDLWLELKLTEIYDHYDVQVGRLFRFSDITPRKKTEDALKLSEHKSRAILEAIPDIMFIIRKDGTFIDFKSPSNDYLALSPEKIVGSNISELKLTPHYLELVRSKIKNTIDNSVREKFEYELELEGNINYFEARLTKLNSNEVLAIIRNISEIKEIQKSLRESESLYRTLFENTGVPTGIFNKKGLFTLVNHKMEEFLNSSKKELEFKKTWMDFTHPDDLHRMIEYNKIRQKNPEKAPNTYETRLIDNNRDAHLSQIMVDHIPYLDEYVVSVVDITPLKEAQKKLEDSEKKYREIFENVQDVLYQADNKGKIIDISPSINRYSGFDREKMIGSPIESWYHQPEDRQELLNQIKEKGEVDHYEVRLRNDLNDTFYVSINAHLRHNKKGEIIGVEGSLRDISEQKRIEKEMEYRLELESLLMDISKNFINKKPEMVDDAINEALQKIGEFKQVDRSYLFQLNPDGNLLSNTHEWCAPHIEPQIDNLQNLEKPFFRWSLGKLKSKGQIHIKSVKNLPDEAKFERKLLLSKDTQSMTAVAMKFHGKVLGYVGFDMVKMEMDCNKGDIDLLILMGEIFTNLLEKRYTEENMEKSIKEKEVLLREIHHRVKNNMQIVSSLLNLQANFEEEEKVQKVLRESQNRIRSMSIVHEKLYQSTSLSEIEFGSYLQQLIKDIFLSYTVSPEKIRPIIDAEDIYINLDTAIPLGLIVNELLTNSIKYAFKGRDTGTLKINFNKIDDEFILKVSDDGVGLGPDVDIDSTKTLGLQLVKSLSTQLDADLKIDGTKGTSFTFKFKEISYRNRI
ncbi:MAG: histidine kinase N-terminal 7TM domain-containing protein [Methanobacteriaceae archaeon]|nr:histidine kinase N-terminal 7TM domain-containing protein [Methanobacteriaceae archaeon]